ncbi:MAG: PP0621 family protein [Aliarcobacter sp.]|jgi:uncharacterized protein|nr:PP0621 family protein [Aliarcobacter sp.]
MVLKVIFIIILAFLAYVFFFKKAREKDNITKKNERIEDEMVECPVCKTYVSKKEGILSNGKFYCSQECLENK